MLMLALLSSAVHAFPGIDSAAPDDWNRTTPELIRSRGFACFEHEITTSDNYVIKLFRIRHPTRLPDIYKNPVLFVHGLFHSSSQWLVNSDDGYVSEGTHIVGNSLPFEMAKRGFDVWLGNLRGNLECLGHKTLDHRESKYWRHNFDDFTFRDLPAMIQTVLQRTAKERLDYVGHSIGSAVLFALLTVSPKYNTIVHRFIAYPPVAYLASQGGLQAKTAGLPQRKRFENMDNRYPANLMQIRKTIKSQCTGSAGGRKCKRFFNMHDGSDNEQLQDERVVVYLSHLLKGTSFQMMAQQTQWANQGTFARYDYGTEGNMDKYGSPTAPNYTLSAIRHPAIHAFYGESDAISSPDDVFRLVKEIPVTVLVYRVGSPKWNHFNFVYGKDAGAVAHHQVIDILSRMQESKAVRSSFGG